MNGASSGAVSAFKRQRSSHAFAGRSTVQDHLKDIGQRTALLQREFDNHESELDEKLQRSLWQLLLEARPFLFLSSSREAFTMPVDVLRYRVGERQRDRSHVRLAVRLYLALLRMAVRVPGAVLHGCLVLLALLPVLADPHTTAQVHTGRFMDGLRFALLFLHTWDIEAFSAVMGALLAAEDGVGCCVLSPIPASQEHYGLCRFEVGPSPKTQEALQALQLHSTEGVAVRDLSELFCCAIVAESQLEVACVCFGVSTLCAQILQSNVFWAPSIAQSTLVTDLTCSLLSVQVFHSSERDNSVNVQASSLLRLPAVSEAAQSDASPSLEQNENAFHSTAVDVLLTMLSHQLLFPHIHGPTILCSLVMFWRGQRSAASISRGEVILLRWLCGLSPVSDTEVFPGPTAALAASSFTWLPIVFLQNNLLEHVFGVLLQWTEGTLSRVEDTADEPLGSTSGDDTEALLLLLRLVSTAMTAVDPLPAKEKTIIASRRVGLLNHLDRMLALKISISMWSHDLSHGASAAHIFWGLLPSSYLEPVVQDALVRARGSLGDSEFYVVEANALACLRCAGVCAEKLTPQFTEAIEKTTTALLHRPDANSALLMEAVVVLLRYVPEVDESAVIKALRGVDELAVRIFALPTPFSKSLWMLFLTEVSRALPLPQVETAASISNALRRAIGTARSADFSSFLLRFAGISRGLQSRLCQGLAPCYFLRNDAVNGKDRGGDRLQTQIPRHLVRSLLLLLGEVKLVLKAAVNMLTILLEHDERFIREQLEVLTVIVDSVRQLELCALTAEATVTSQRSPLQDSDIVTSQVALPKRSLEVVVDVDDDGEEQADVAEKRSPGGEEDDALEVQAVPHEGDGAALRELVKQFMPPLVRFARKLEATSLSSEGSACGPSAFEAGEHAAWLQRLREAVLKLVCTSVAVSPQSGEADEHLFTTVATHDNPIVRCGYGSLGLYRVITCRPMFSLKQSCQAPDHGDTWLLSGGAGDWHIAQKLEMIRVTLQRGWNEFLCADSETSVTRRPVFLSEPDINGESVPVQQCERAAHELMDACHDLWECSGTSFMLRAMSLETAHTTLDALHWSVEDLCRWKPRIVYSSFFSAVCDAQDAKPKSVVCKLLDVLLAPNIVENGCSAEESESRLADIAAHLEGASLTEVAFAPVIAFILYRCGGAISAAKADRIQRLMTFQKRPLDELPRCMMQSLASVVLHIISLEADAQLAAAAVQSTLRSGGGTPVSMECNSIAFSVFSLAVQTAVALSEFQPGAADYKRALESPVSGAVASQTLVKSVFDILDSINSCMGIHQVHTRQGSPSAPSASVTTVRRWLTGLASFVQFMGTSATLIAAKLPAMLESCSTVPALVRPTCLVWNSLIHSCADDYLVEHAPAMVVDLLSLEFYYEVQEDSLAILEVALRHLYAKTLHEPFWQSYVQVMGHTSRLMQRLRDTIKLPNEDTALPRRKSTSDGSDDGHQEGKALKATPDGRSAARGSSQAAVVVAGFLAVMQSSSTKCKAVFVRALYQYLRDADQSARLEMTREAAASNELVPALLQWARELEEPDVQVALQCVGMIGAVAPRPTTSAESNTAAPAAEAAHFVSPRTAAGSSQGYLLSVDAVLHWRELARVLLDVYCPRALANTADGGMHDRAAYAIQELLRVCTKKERLKNNGISLRDDEVLFAEELQRYSWWAKLNPKSRQMLEGFTTTRYTTLVVQPSERRTPEYHRGLPFQPWLFNFFRNLASRCAGSFGETVACLRNVAKRDHTLILFLVPYITVHLLQHGDAAAWEDTLKEIDVLFDAALHGVGPPAGQLTLRSQNVMEVGANKDAACSVDEHVQFILHLLEDINRLHWSLLRIGRKLEHPVMDEPCSEEACLRLAKCCKEFLDRVPWSKKALAALEIGSNMRALRCIEGQRRLPKVATIVAAVPLQRIFAALDDRDSARSIHRQSHGLTPADAAFSFENNGDWSLALQNCELVLQHNPHSVPHQFTCLRCMRQLGQLHLMSRYAEALLGRDGGTEYDALPSTAAPSRSTLDVQQRATLQNYANEAAWRLGEWDKVQSDPSLPVSLAEPMVEWTEIVASGRTAERVHRAVALQRSKLIPAIRAACREGYAQGYPYVAMLHALADVEMVAEVLTSSVSEGEHKARHRHKNELAYSSGAVDAAARVMRSDVSWRPEVLARVESSLRQRMECTDATLEAREPLLSLHRSIYKALGMGHQVAETWLQHAELLRNGGFSEAALNAARQTDFDNKLTNPLLYTVTAELLHDMNTPMQAIEFAQEHFNDTTLSSATRAQLQVLITDWMLEIGSQTPKEVAASYQAALTLDESEIAHHRLALFYDKLYNLNQSSVDSQRRSASSTDKVAAAQTVHDTVQWVETYAIRAIEHFGKALQKGIRTVSVSLPRMLTLWLDCSATLCGITADTSSRATNAERVLKRMNTLIEAAMFSSSGSVPPYVVVTALPQLLSRLCHPSALVVTLITRIVVFLMGHFPMQCLWMVLPIAFSKQVVRSQIAKQNIIQVFTQQKNSHKVQLENAFAIFTSLIDLCNCPAGAFANNAKLTKQPFIQRVEHLLPRAKFILPTMTNLSPDIAAAAEGKSVFPNNPTFDHFDDRVQVMSSLQKPKRIAVYSNEGNLVPFLCKSKDEPRKDIRMMEVASLMNTFFLADPEARRKRFALRRYSIAALTDDCAIIEWVNNISPLRSVAINCYGLDGTGVRVSQVKAWLAKVENKAMTKLEMFTQHILPAAPAVLHQWFDMAFTSNQEWYAARSLFTQSTALWSIAGHVVGLGDRHGENLMIDLRRGEMLHVDFACMFDKGETLEVPERVRFRLTPNLIDGMGVLGADGPFRATCEVALRCQMKNKNAVMSVVETLLHDPLVEWTSRGSRSQAVDPRRLIDRVSRRLDGFLDLFSIPREVDALALNVEGQVSKLISHASAIENLSEMYIWWMAWI